MRPSFSTKTRTVTAFTFWSTLYKKKEFICYMFWCVYTNTSIATFIKYSWWVRSVQHFTKGGFSVVYWQSQHQKLRIYIQFQKNMPLFSHQNSILFDFTVHNVKRLHCVHSSTKENGSFEMTKTEMSQLISGRYLSFCHYILIARDFENKQT